MNPPALSLPRDVKQPDRPQPRDPQAAGGPMTTSSEPADASLEEAFKTLVEQITSPASQSWPAKAELDGGKAAQDGEAEAEKPADGRDATEAAKTAPPTAIPLVFAQPQPPAPPHAAQNAVAPQGDEKGVAEKPVAHRTERAGPIPGRDALKPAADSAEPKKNGPAHPAPVENFASLVAEAKPAAEASAMPQALPHAGTPRALEPVPPAPQPLPSPVAAMPVVALPATIAIKAMEGTNRFDIRLDPEELGRIDVSLQIDKDGGIRASIAAEKPEALQLIVREARSLEQAFDQAGFRRDNDALSFSLSDQREFAQGRQDPQPQQQQQRGTRFFLEGEPDLPPSLATLIASADGRLDVRI